MTSPPACFDGFLRAADGRIVDGTGNPVLLRGVGLGNWLLPEGYMWKFTPSAAAQSPREIEALFESLVGTTRADEFWQRFRQVFVNEDDIARIRAEGMNHVRLPINSRVVMDDDGALVEEGFALIDQLIEWCRTHRLWVVLDLHGAPGGQTGTNIDDSPRGIPELFTEPRYRELTIRLWRAIAERYRDEPVVAAYDLLNEPLPNEYQHRHADDLAALYIDLTKAIREIDQNHLLCYEGTHWATNWSIFTEVWDPNSMLQFHRYWSPPDRPGIQRFIDTGRRLGLPVYMGEGGENNLAWLQTAFQLYEDCGIGWNFWPWKKIDTLTSPCSVDAPAGWADILAHAAGSAPQPHPDQAWDTLTALLDVMPIARCTYRPEVIRALMRRVPLEIPASGFGFLGAGVSYRSTGAEPLRGFRSDEQVTIRHAGGTEPENIDFEHMTGAPRTVDQELFLELGAGDWVRYDIEVTTPLRLDVLVELSADPGEDHPAPLDVLVDREPADAVPTPGNTLVRAVTPTTVQPGRHTLQLTGRAPAVVVCFVHVSEAVPEQPSEAEVVPADADRPALAP
ncbi:glycoside hydrolase family 5 protein [Streptomyces sp. NBC_00080]|uniref:glycoside hydrolase family 5 protein n=1 Tax=Streptomyces sp. NBC_00080 TaxID=2975645 RepID=UPI00324F5390